MLNLKWWFIKWIFNDMAFYHHVLLFGLFEWAWVVQKRIYFTILGIDVTVLSFCWLLDHLYPPGHHSKVIRWLSHWMKPPDLVDHQGTFVHFRAILDAAIVFAMLTLGFSKVSDEISESAMYDWYIHVYPMYDWYIFHLQLAIAGIFHMSTYGYPVRNWQKSIAPEAIVQLWKSSRNHMGRQ